MCAENTFTTRRRKTKKTDEKKKKKMFKGKHYCCLRSLFSFRIRYRLPTIMDSFAFTSDVVENYQVCAFLLIEEKSERIIE